MGTVRCGVCPIFTKLIYTHIVVFFQSTEEDTDETNEDSDIETDDDTLPPPQQRRKLATMSAPGYPENQSVRINSFILSLQFAPGSPRRPPPTVVKINNTPKVCVPFVRLCGFHYSVHRRKIEVISTNVPGLLIRVSDPCHTLMLR